ncbi:MAG: YceI family protein [Gemmatimonadaceae bacterium]
MKKISLKHILIAGTIVGLSAVSASAQMALSPVFSLSKDSRLWLDGTSNVKAFSCSAKKIDANVVADLDVTPAAMVKTASLLVPVASLDCKNGTMNEHMRKALKAKDNPQIVWNLISYRVTGTAVVMKGTLKIAGKENPIELRGTGSAENGVIRVKGSKQIRMTEFGVKPPSLMLGTMKVGDAVTVSYDFVLNQ